MRDAEPKKPMFSRREKLVGAGMVAAGALITAYAVAASNEQANGFDDSLSEQASAAVLGFANVVTNSEFPAQTVFGEVKSAHVTLTDGGDCDVQYTTFSDGSAITLFGMVDNQATIVDYGTRPTATASVVSQ